MKPRKPGTETPERIKAVIDVTRSGKGFLLVEEGDDILVPRENLGTALSGDVVEASVSKRGSQKIGRVINILERKTGSFVGEIVKGEKGMMLHSDDPRVYVNFLIVGSPGAPEGHKAILDVVEWTANPPLGKIREVIGPKGDHETEMRAIVASKGFDSDFPPEVLREAEELYKRLWDEDEIATRRDFRKILTFTIDPETAKDFDDAISFQTLENGDIEVGIHIADVTHFVRPGTALDAEAFKRATSVYLVDRTVPMLPPQLSDDLCSLKPNVDRLTFSAVFTIENSGGAWKIKDRWFGRTIICSQKRFTYEEADESLKDATKPLHDELSIVWKFAEYLRKKRQEDGAIMFGTDEVRPVLNEHGEVVSFKRTVYTESHQLIEELMLLANREVAGFVSKTLGKTNRLFVYRIHDVPNSEKIEELSVFLRAIGYQLVTNGKGATAKDINKLLAEIKGSPEEHLIKTATVRSMAKAVYTTKNIGHFGLAFDDYAHFTSPIRRYADTMVHRTLFTLLNNKKPTEGSESIEKKAVHVSAREVSAAEAERASIKLKQVEYFSKKIGEVRAGVVAGVTEWGIYIEDKETGTEGMVRLMSLADDTYEHDRKKFAVVGVNTKKVIRLGDPVTFKVESANVDDRTIDFSLQSTTPL